MIYRSFKTHLCIYFNCSNFICQKAELSPEMKSTHFSSPKTYKTYFHWTYRLKNMSNSKLGFKIDFRNFILEKSEFKVSAEKNTGLKCK
jgi:hypothetical protein